MVLMGNFNHPDMWWKGNTARHNESRFLRLPGITSQHRHCTGKAGAMHRQLPLFANKEKLVVDVAINGSLGCSNHEIMEFKILRGSDEGK